MTRTSTGSGGGLPPHIQITDENFLEMYTQMEEQQKKSREEISKLMSDIVDLTSATGSLNKELDKAAKEIINCEDIISKQKNSIDTLSQDKQQLQEEVHTLRDKLEDAKKFRREADSEWVLKVKKFEEEKVKESREYLERIAHLSESLDKEKAAKASLESIISQKDTLISSHEQKISNLNDRLGQCGRQVNSFTAELEDLKTKSGNQKREILNMTQEIYDLTEKVSALRATLHQKDEQIKSMEKDHDEELNQLISSYSYKDSIIRDKEVIIDSKDRLLRDKDKLIDSLESHNKKLESSLGDREYELQDLKSKAADYALLDSLKKQLEERDKIIADKDREIVSLRESGFSGDTPGNFRDWFDSFSKE